MIARTTALVIVPPPLKSQYGPLLGPAMLVGAGRRASHGVRVLDFNERWLRSEPSLVTPAEPRCFVGDHDRPPELSDVHAAFKGALGLDVRQESHIGVSATATRLVNSVFGVWVSAALSSVSNVPRVVGLSVLYRDQVELALAITLIARRVWPGALIVWGGAHVTALREEIANDARYGCGGVIDRFVFGYAERTWVDLLDAVARGAELPRQLVKAGAGHWEPALDDGSVVPTFDDVSTYPRTRLTLPIQSSRGCGYGKCTYCTYPAIEGLARLLPLGPIHAVVEEGVRLDAAVSFKDSLVSVERLEELATVIRGRIPWSACTKLCSRLDASTLDRLAGSGLRTLEIGLETLDEELQRLIAKRQPARVLSSFLDAASNAGIAVVVNYMTGLPHADPANEEACRAGVEALLETRPSLLSKLEHNRFQLERLSSMGRDPAAFRLRVVGSAPWSSILAWEPLSRLVILRGRRGRS